LATKSGSPDAGDFIWIDLDPTKGHEHRSSRPALVISPRLYNERTGVCIACPITNQAKGYPFEVPIPLGQAVTGVALSDQLRCLSWPERNMRIVGAAPTEVLDEVCAKIATLIGIA
jgi:mRNA interferase MazF